MLHVRSYRLRRDVPVSALRPECRTYLERATGPDWRRRPPSPVVVLARWGTGKGVIRTVAIRRANGEVAIRPFRGLRRIR